MKEFDGMRHSRLARVVFFLCSWSQRRGTVDPSRLTGACDGTFPGAGLLMGLCATSDVDLARQMDGEVEMMMPNNERCGTKRTSLGTARAVRLHLIQGSLQQAHSLPTTRQK